jgi:hypothetical protein
MAPFVRDEPEELWLRARDQGAIPPSLFDLYRRASYLSFGSAPAFLKDGESILFSYFALMMRSLAQSLADADGECKELLEANKEICYLGKHLDDPTWTREKSEATAKRAKETFRDLLMSLHASLDALSEIVAVFSQGTINNLQVGRAQFSSIETWLKSNYKQPSIIATPRDVYLIDLHAKLQPIIHSQSPEAEWLPYMRHLRNKLVHLGDGPFRTSVLRWRLLHVYPTRMALYLGKAFEAFRAGAAHLDVRPDSKHANSSRHRRICARSVVQGQTSHK